MHIRQQLQSQRSPQSKRLERMSQPALFSFILSSSRHYGPKQSSDGINELPKNQHQSSSNSSTDGSYNVKKERLRALVEKVMQTPKPEHIPRLLVNNIELILGLQGEEGTRIISSLLHDAAAADETKKSENEPHDANCIIDYGALDNKFYDRTAQTIDDLLSFTEDFVQEAKEMDQGNKKLLGKIIRAMTLSENNTSNQGVSSNTGDSNREETLDRLMKEEKNNFTVGFLKHIEGECDRITNAPNITPESTRLLNILRLIQTRVLEELGHNLGEAALVLGQLIGYDDDSELLGVLEASLKVQGRDFAVEMHCLTKEALAGFQSVPGGADSDLIRKVTLINDKLNAVLDETSIFQ